MASWSRRRARDPPRRLRRRGLGGSLPAAAADDRGGHDPRGPAADDPCGPLSAHALRMEQLYVVMFVESASARSSTSRTGVRAVADRCPERGSSRATARSGHQRDRRDRRPRTSPARSSSSSPHRSRSSSTPSPRGLRVSIFAIRTPRAAVVGTSRAGGPMRQRDREGSSRAPAPRRDRWPSRGPRGRVRRELLSVLYTIYVSMSSHSPAPASGSSCPREASVRWRRACSSPRHSRVRDRSDLVWPRDRARVALGPRRRSPEGRRWSPADVPHLPQLVGDGLQTIEGVAEISPSRAMTRTSSWVASTRRSSL